jgi:DNA replication and repair protein RecF
VLVVGPNGAGKTNLLESLHVVTQGFSPRTRSDGQLVRFGAQEGRIEANGRRGSVPCRLRVDLSTNQAKRAELNGRRLSAAEQLRRELQTLVFTPDRLAVVKGGPAARRAYFDRVLGRLTPARMQLPAEYAAAVGQRNAALRRVGGGLSSLEALAPWTHRVAELGSELVDARLDALTLLSPGFGAVAKELGLHGAHLSYEGESPDEQALEEVLSRDLERGTTGLGPHLHDVCIQADAHDLRSFGSQGEQRVAVLALLLAEARLVDERRGYAPLLLLDDVLSELDAERRAALVRLLPGGQTVVTSTAREALPAEPTQLVRVEPGRAEAA